MFYKIVQWTLRLIFSWPIYIDIVRHDYSITGNKIFAANHPSTLDPVMLIIALDDRIHTLIAQSVFNIPIIGHILRIIGNIPVADGQGKNAYQNALTKLREGKNILIFPEGRLSDETGSVGESFSGAVRLAIEAQVPIVPIGISFFKNKAYYKKMLIKNKPETARFYFFGRYTITLGSPIYFLEKNISNETVQLKKKILMEEIKKLSEESAIRLYS